jgi:hypothetical protein
VNDEILIRLTFRVDTTQSLGFAACALCFSTERNGPRHRYLKMTGSWHVRPAWHPFHVFLLLLMQTLWRVENE